jgi:hypothetical protein
LEDGSVLARAVAGNLRMGGQVWFGEDDVRDAVVETVEAADRAGWLRGILDAVRSHRVEDDFFSHWSYVREDFERKLHGKRRKVSPTTSSRGWMPEPGDRRAAQQRRDQQRPVVWPGGAQMPATSSATSWCRCCRRE